MKMLMTLSWSSSQTFIFSPIHSQHWATFTFLTLLSFLWSFLTIALPSFKSKLLPANNPKAKSIAFSFVYYLVYSALHVGNMLLVMTYNGWVVVAVVLGLGLGYWLMGTKDEDEDLPINCCISA